MGANGSGKSTIMKLVAGLLLPSRGRVRLLGALLRRGEISPRIGYLIERPRLNESLSMFDNLMGRALALGLVDPRRAVWRALDATGTRDAARELPGSCSLGTRQKVGVALALMGDPRVLLLDEPFNGLDIPSVRRLRAAVVSASVQRRCGVLVCSHVPDQLVPVASRVYLLHDGSMGECLTSAEIEARRARRFVVRSAEAERALVVLQERFAGQDVAIDEHRLVSLPCTVAPSDITRALIDAGVFFSDITSQKESLNGFFSSLIEGGDNERQ